MKFWEKFSEGADPEKIKKMVPEINDPRVFFVPPDRYDNPVEYLKEKLWETQKSMSYYQETAAAARQRIAELESKQERIKSMKEFSIEKSADSYAQLGAYAWQKSHERHLKKPLFVAPELIFPEQYGGHPEELRDIILESRRRMVEYLTQKEIKIPNKKEKIENPLLNYKGFKLMSKKEAEKVARDSIKATFDVAHANTWYRYFDHTKPKEEFDKWLMEQVKKLQKDDVLGHVHLSDNMGFVDEHGLIGSGNTPVKEFLAHLQKTNYSGKAVVEPGHHDYQGLKETWRLMNSPAYKIGSDVVGFAEISGAHYGKTYAPNYLFGQMAPNPREWVMWSELPLE